APALELSVGVGPIAVAGTPQSTVELCRVLIEWKRGCQIGTAPKPRAAGAQITQIHVNGRHIRIAHVGHQRDPTGDEPTLRLRRAGNLSPCGLRKDAPYVTHVDANLLEHLTPHKARFTASLQAVPGRFAPASGLEAAGGFE